MKIFITSCPLHHCPSLTAQFLHVQCCMEGFDAIGRAALFWLHSLCTSASSLMQLIKETSDLLQAPHH